MSISVPALEPCPFCEYLSGKAPCAFVARGATVSAFMNRAQYERGALLVVPNAHVETILDTDATLMNAVYAEAHRVAKAMVPLLGATGLNIFQNNGAASGQTVPHFHVHVIPRYPTSDPAQRFREGAFPQTPIEELEKLAKALRAAVSGGQSDQMIK